MFSSAHAETLRRGLGARPAQSVSECIAAAGLLVRLGWRVPIAVVDRQPFELVTAIDQYRRVSCSTGARKESALPLGPDHRDTVLGGRPPLRNLERRLNEYVHIPLGPQKHAIVI